MGPHSTGKREASASPDRIETEVDNRKRPRPSSPPSSPHLSDPALLLSPDHGHADSTVSWSKFQHIFVFGDSYSSDTRNNWIGHLKKSISSSEGSPIVHNFAVAGDTVEDDLGYQTQRLFEEYPTAAVLENSESALLVIWMGINDCGCTAADELGPIVEKLFDAMHDIYLKLKGRYFLLMDVPPMQRSPGGIEMDIDSERYDTWNAELLAHATGYSKTASQASVFVVSAHQIISDILDNPKDFGFSSDSAQMSEEESEENSEESFKDSDDEDGNRHEGVRIIWEDDFHISRATHHLIADRLLRIFDCR